MDTVVLRAAEAVADSCGGTQKWGLGPALRAPAPGAGVADAMAAAAAPPAVEPGELRW